MPDIIENGTTEESVNHDESKPIETSEKILGKFEDAKALQEGYVQLEKAYSAKENFEKKYNEALEAGQVPETYKATGDLMTASDDRLRELATEAKELGLNQSQFEKYAVRNLGNSSQEAVEKPSTDEDFKSYLKEEVGLSDGMINNMSPEDVQHFQNKRSKSINTNTSVASTGYTSGKSTDEQRLEAYREYSRLEHSGNRAAAQKALDKWINMASGN